MKTQRTLIIGLDGGTFGLIKPMVRAGYLPVLGKLMAEGTCGYLNSWPNLNSEAGWSSLITGYNPGRHNVYGSTIFDRSSYSFHPTSASDRMKDPFWQYLSRAGQRVGIMNVPLCYPADPINGFMFSGIPATGRSARLCYPNDLFDKLSSQNIDYAVDIPNLPELCYRNPKLALHKAVNLIHNRSRAALHLIESHSWDLMMVVFTVTDILQHFFWPEENTFPESDSWLPLRSIYQQIDTFIRDALALVNDSVTVMVVSDHGFGPARWGQECLNQLLEQLGLLCRNQTRPRRLPNRLLSTMLHYGRKIIPLRFQDPLARMLPGLHGRALRESEFAGVDWSQSRVYARKYGNGLRINLNGREGQGIVFSSEYESLRERVRQILLDLTDPDTGRCVVQAVHRREKAFNGPYLEQAADLLIEWNNDALRDALCYRTADRLIVVRSPEKHGRDRCISGLHRSSGILIARGPCIRQGFKVENAHVYDVAPTIFHLYGISTPADLDGRVLVEMFAS
ncbi:MAG: alkaline phosphatase family protein [Anaerolineales bacterium]|nr:alkaline phosphatase family protein [Anaerolineales bacterium]